MTRLAPVFILFALAACGDASGPPAGVQDQIIFVSDRDTVLAPHAEPNGALYRMNADGTGLRRIGPVAYYNGLRLSPDRRRLVFYNTQSGCYDIRVMNVQDTISTQLTGVQDFERCNVRPFWSPDGARIAFTSSRNSAYGWDAYVMNADGTGVVNVSNSTSTELGTNSEHVHGWSPDGRVIVWSNRDGVTRTYLVNPDGSGFAPMSGTDAAAIPEWSPDGRLMAFTGERNGDAEVFLMNSDGTGPLRNLSNMPGFDYFTRWTSPWSPDGRRIAFSSGSSPDIDIWVVNPDGSGLTNMTRSPGRDDFLQWLPDSRRILFTSNRGGKTDLYLVASDGTGLVNLTGTPDANELRAVWVPRR